jgi:hypothetical protein
MILGELRYDSADQGRVRELVDGDDEAIGELNGIEDRILGDPLFQEPEILGGN